MSERGVTFIVNPAAASGRGQARWAELKPSFLQDHTGARVLFTSQPREAVHLAQEAALSCDFLVAVGGDGTVFEVVSGLLLSGASDVPFGIVPIGTGNDVARQCGIGDTAKAREVLRGGHAKSLDVIRIQCRGQEQPVVRFALLYGAVGIISEVLRQTTPRVKRLFGPSLAYYVGALRAILSYQSPPMRVTCDGQTQEKRFLMICASNSEQAGGGMRLAPGALMDDGLLNVNVCEAISRARTVTLLWHIFRGRELSHPKLRYFPARAVSVEADPPIEVEADGELIGHTPARFEVVPRVLNVLVP
jgi:YegS/Rv2252/BmrU family lipid kinase